MKVCPVCGEMALYGFYCDNDGPRGPHPHEHPDLETILVAPVAPPVEVTADNLSSV